jgi:phage shock protein E
MNKIIIDVREPEEYATGHVEGAINLPSSKLLVGLEELSDISNSTEIVLYCVSGGRAGEAGSMLRAQGFTNITNGINKQQVQAEHL